MTAEVVNGSSSNGHHADNGHDAAAALALEQRSSYLKYLPAIFWQDPFIGRFLHIFEDILSPLQETVNRRSEQFDPALASDSMLAFLASWVGADEIGGLPEAQARRLVSKAITLNQWRGTKKGLRMALEIVTNREPLITEYSQGLVLGQDAVLGLNTSLQSGQPLHFSVLFDCREDEVNSALVHAVIRRYKPAAAVYSVSFAS